MATIKTRQRLDGSLAYLSEVRVKRDGLIVDSESRAFDRRTQAKTWADSRERNIAKKIPAAKPSLILTQATLKLRRYSPTRGQLDYPVISANTES